MVMAFALVLVGCQQPSSGGDSGSVAVDWSKAAVGYIVLTDGTFVSPDNFNTGMTAAAVIVRAKSEYKPALGVGIHHNRTGLAWCTNDANAYNVKITDLQSDNCKDGSDGWYLPTVAELETIDSKRSKINESLKTAGGNQFEKSYYWSCCQSFSDKYAYELYFGNGSTGDNNKYNDNYVCSVRAFN